MEHHHVDRSVRSLNSAFRRRLVPLKANGIFGAGAAPRRGTTGAAHRSFSTTSRSWPRVGLVGILVATLALAASTASLPSPALGASPDVVISQVYAGASNESSLPYDFVELFNPTSDDIVIDDWSVQYAAAEGDTWTVVPLRGVVPARGHILVRGRGRWDATGLFPRPDAIGSFDLSTRGGKVALVVPGITLACGATAGDCLPDTAIRDFVGYGTAANTAEGGHPAPAPGNASAILRSAAGTDTDDNQADFTPGAPSPHTSGLPGAACDNGDPPAEAVAIWTIQGAAHRSAAEDEVRTVRGVVTGTREDGFYLQDMTPDADPATSNAIFVYTLEAPCVLAGDAAVVRGKIREYRPGDPTNLTKTELANAEVWWLSEDNPLPAPVVLGPAGRMPPTEVIDDDGVANVEEAGTFDPTGDALDFFESLEGMVVRIDDAAVVGPRTGAGWIPVLAADGAGAGLLTGRGGIVLRAGDLNPERLILDDEVVRRHGGINPVVAVGDRLPGALLGVVDYELYPGAPELSAKSGAYRIQLLAPPGTPAFDHMERESGPEAEPAQLAIASFNVHNLAGDADQVVFDRLAEVIVDHLHAPDLIALQEVQDNDGAGDPSGQEVVDATETLTRLTTAIATRDPALVYDWLEIPPEFAQDGGTDGGTANIRVALLYRTGTPLTVVERPGAGPTTANAVECTSGAPSLRFSPGRVEPAAGAFADSRKPLAAEFTLGERSLFVIANHFASKLGDRSAFGLDQISPLESEGKRVDQANLVRAFTDEILECDPEALVVVLGDLNDFQFSPAVLALSTGEHGLTNLIGELPEQERYTYVHEGNSQAIDHLLVSSNLLEALQVVDVVHRHAEYPEIMKNPDGTTVHRASDHDPLVAVFTVPD